MNRAIAHLPAVSLSIMTILLSVSGCTYNGTLDETFHKPSARHEFDREKIPVSIAVVKGPEIKETTFAASNGGHGVEIPLGDSICQAVQSELAGIFVKSGIVEDTKADNFDLYVYPRVEWIETGRDWNTGRLWYTAKFDATVRSERYSYTVSKFAAKKKIAYVPPGEAVGAQILTGASLGLLAPVTVPVTTQAVGAHAKELIGQTISEFVKEFGDSIVESGRAQDFALLLKQGATPAAIGSSSTEPASTAPARPASYKRAKSKYDAFLDAVVTIQTAEAAGSGFFVNGDGLIVTNEHVVHNETTVSVRTRDGGISLGQVIAKSAAKDLALVRVPVTHHIYLHLSGGEHAGIGNDVIAIGTPEGLDWSVSRGIISAVRFDGSRRLVQTDAAINHGNSGGPLIELASGYVVGVNTIGIRRDVAVGLSFAVSSQDVQITFAQYLKP